MPFTPPYPPRKSVGGPLATLRAARDNFIAVLTPSMFEAETVHRKYLNQVLFFCNSPKTVRQVFIDDAANVEPKSQQMIHVLRPLLGNGLFVSEGAHWAKHRRIIAPLTHISRLAQFVPAMSGAVAHRAEQWRAARGTEIDILAEMAELTADVIGRAVFGGKLGVGAAKKIVQNFSAYQRTVGTLDLASMLGLPDYFPRWQSRATIRAAESIKALVSEMIAALDAIDPGEREGLVSMMLDAFRAEGVAPGDVRDEATVLLMAGHETTANTLAWAWYCLSQDEVSWNELRDELRSLGRPPVDLDDVERLRFTRAVIDETLRLFPPVPILARRSREDREIEGHHVPAGSFVAAVPWLLHRHKKLWREPDLFDPWRFMPNGGGAPDRYCYLPFSIGPRICTGMAFALTEAVICLATLAQVARPKLREGHPVMPCARLSLRPGEYLPMVLDAGALES